MKNIKSKFILAFLIILLIVIGLIIAFINYNTNYAIKEIFNEKTKTSSVRINNIEYPEICLENVEAGLFSTNTVERFNDIYFCYNNLITSKENNIKLIKKDIFQTTQYGYKEIKKNEFVYFAIDDNRIYTCFVNEHFTLPELNIDNIEQIRLEYINNETYRNKERIITDRAIIKELLTDSDNCFKKNQITDIYVKYNNYDFEEWFDIDKIKKIALE